MIDSKDIETTTEPMQEAYYRLGIAKFGELIIVPATGTVGINEAFFVDRIEYQTIDDASKALLAYKLMFNAHLTPTDRCVIAGYLRQSISQGDSQEIP